MKISRFFLSFLFAVAAEATLFCEEEPTVFTKLFPAQVVLQSSLGTPELLAENGVFRAYSLLPGRHRITLSAEGYVEKQIDLTVFDGMLLQEKLERKDSRLRLIGELPTGRQPKSADFSPDGQYLVIPCLDDAGIDLYGTDPLRFIKTLNPPEADADKKGFVESIFLPHRGELWVSQMSTGKIQVFDTTSWAWKAAYSTGGLWPKVLCPSPDGGICCVSNWASGTVAFLETSTGRIRALIPVGGTPRGMAFSPDGRELYVALFDTGNVAVIDCEAFRYTRTIILGPGAARHTVLHQDGKRMYVTDMYNGLVLLVDPVTGKVLQRRYVGPNPNTLRLSPDGSFIFVSLRGRNNPETYLLEGPEFGKVVMLDADTLEPEDWVWGRNQPTGLALSPRGNLVVFTDFLDDLLEIYRLDTGKDQ
ncbi:MAG: hypothetical protein JW760_04080 [Spirochaetales bacterium]|nr:hypothetical protein [Spirochaetales bacterium]